MARLLACVLLLASAGPLRAQPIPAKGTAATLDVATWNVEWFGASNGPSDDEQQFQNVQAVIDAADIDLWGLQEVANTEFFDRLLDSLGTDYAGFLATNSGQQRIGFVYKPSVVTVRQARHILETFDFEFAGRPPLQLSATITLPDTSFAATFIVVHMKATAETRSYERRREAAQRLKNHVDFTSLESEAVVILGDFNDELTRSITSGRASPYDPFVQDTDDYFFPTLTLEEADLGTFCGNSSTCASTSTIDHILVTNELAPAYEPSSAGRYDELLTAVSGFVRTTSDHLPVFARFAFSTETSVARTTQKTSLALEPPHPNPARASTLLSYRLSRATPVRLVLYDLLGRQRQVLVDRVQPAGTYEVRADLANMPPGSYVARLEAAGQSQSHLIVRLR